MNGAVDSYSLSSPQEQVWFHQAFLPEVPLYNIGGLVRIDGPIESLQLRRAIREVVQDTDALRICLLASSGLPRQTFNADPKFSVEIYDYSQRLSPEEDARAWMLADFTVPFRPDENPLFRFAILQVAPTRHFLFHKYHHLVTDGWGISLVVKRIAAHYNALAEGRSIAGQDVTLYSDFVLSEQRYIESPNYKEDQRYWVEKLRDLPEPLALKRVSGGPSKSLSFTLDRKRYQDMDAVCQRHGASIFHLLVAAICIYCARTAGRNEILLGLPALNRRTPLERSTAGLYAGLKPARFRYERNLSVLGFVQHIRQELGKDYRRYRFPLSKMSRAGAVRDGEIAGLFDIVLSFERHDYDARVAGNGVYMEALSNGFEQNGLAIFIRDYHLTEDVKVDFNYNLSAFTDFEMQVMVESFQELLRDACEHPGKPVGRLNIMPETDRRKMLEEWSAGPAKESGGSGCVQDYVSARARREPAQAAMLYAGKTWNYREVVQLANGLAWRLQAAGVGPDVCVGISLGRTPALLIAVLGVLKAGGAYVPIDGELPPERVRWMVEESCVRLVLCEAGDLEWLEADGVRRVQVDVLEIREEAPVVSTLPDHLAYIIYTSGSTGTPKGVMVSHRSIVNYLSFSASSYELIAGDGLVPLHSSLGFDATATSLLAPWFAGLCIEILPGVSGLAALSEAMQGNNSYSLIKLTPAHLPVLEDELRGHQDWSKPRVLVVGGEALNDAALEFWRQYAPETRIVNEYGPTEAAVGCCVFDSCDQFSSGPVPIGRPNWNARLYVLDGEMQLVPVGTLGELYIGGIGVARGYVGRSGLTAERFVPDPFSTAGGERLYRSGDIVRYRANGDLEFLGRRDAQVKLRGHRIELGEIEATILSHPGVGEAVVQIEENGSGHPRLVSYVVAKAGQAAPAAEDLKRHTRQWLPEVMVPTGWMMLDKLPLTLNGKIDRGQLRRMHDGASPAEAIKAPPKPISLLEGHLAAIWSEVLEIPSVGIEDNFFDLGGDSILALRIASRARLLGINVDLRQIFRSQTISSLAQLARRREVIPASQSAKTPTGSAPLTPIQHWLLDQELPDPNHYYQVIELEVAPHVTSEILDVLLSTLISRHDALRLHVARKDGRWTQETGSGQPTSILRVEHIPPMPKEQEATFIAERAKALRDGLNLSDGGLLQALLCVKQSGPSNTLFVAIHHMGVDLVSWNILLDDLDMLYRQRGSGGPPLTLGGTSFRDWAILLSDDAALPSTPAEAEYWQALAHSDRRMLAADVDHPEANTVDSTGRVKRILGVDLTARLMAVAQRLYRCQAHELVLSAVAGALANVSGQREIHIDVEGHGRESLKDIDVSRTVGWFTTICPVQLTVPADRSDLSEVVKAVTHKLADIPRGCRSFGQMRYLGSDETTKVRLESVAVADLLFNYLGQVDRGVSGYGDWFRGFCSLTLERGPDAIRPYKLELDVSMLRGELAMEWTFSRNLHRRETIEALAECCLQSLTTLISSGQNVESRSFMASDFPAARLDQQELDLLLARFR